jgi:hypothetical protein
MLTISPSTPPMNFCKRPSLTYWSKHEPILCTSPTKAVSREVTTDTSASGRLIDPLLYGIVRDWLSRMHNAICIHGGEEEIIWLEGASIIKAFKPLDPNHCPEETVARWHIRMWIYLVVIFW